MTNKLPKPPLVPETVSLSQVIETAFTRNNKVLFQGNMTIKRGAWSNDFTTYNFAQRDAGYCMITSQDRLYTFKWLYFKQFYQCEGCHKILKSVPY